MPGEFSFVVVRRYPRIKAGRLPFLCFVLHRMGFFVPRELLPSGELLPRLFTLTCAFQRTGGLFSVTLSVNARFRDVPAYFTRHAAVWCSDFPPVSLAAHQRSSAIGG